MNEERPPLIISMDVTIRWEAQEVPSLKDITKTLNAHLSEAFKNSDFYVTALTGEFEAEL
jgi:hypothetical protein